MAPRTPALSSSRKAKKLAPKLITLAVAAAFASGAHALPTGAQVVNGQVVVTQPASNVLNIQSSPNAIVNWQQFNIGANESVRIQQQSAASAILNRVVGGDASKILGQLSSNGRVFLINPSGIVFGAGARIDTAGFIASTLNITDSNFLSGKFEFEGSHKNGIKNEGTIKSSGEIILIAPKIENSGILQTEGGDIVLAAGQKVTITNLANPEVRVEIKAPDNEVVNLGKILSSGGAISVFANRLKHSGEINATRAEAGPGGKITLRGDDELTVTAEARIVSNGTPAGQISLQSVNGTTTVAGTIEARGIAATASAVTTATRGGRIEVLGQEVVVASTALIDASGERGGGAIYIGGDYQGGNVALPTRWASNPATQGEATLTATVPASAPSATETASTTPADPAQQTGGGNSGNSPLVPTRSPLQAARNTTVASGARVRADATDSGDGGTIIVWSEGTTTAQGNLSARGGVNGGNGGFVETSGHRVELAGIRVSTLAAHGLAGTWLLDPDDVEIGASLTIAGATLVTPDTVETALAGGNFIIQTTAGGSGGNGDIHVNADLSWSTNRLTLDAYRDININAVMTAGGDSQLTMNSGGSIRTLMGIDGSFIGRVDFGGRSGSGFLSINGHNVTVLTSAEELQSIAADGWYALGNDFSLSGGFSPLVPDGETTAAFSGVLNGLGHTLSGLHISGLGNNFQGLFAEIHGGDVRNLALTDVSVQGSDYVGALAGRTKGATIENVFVSGSVSGFNSVGGLVGSAERMPLTGPNSLGTVFIGVHNDATVNAPGNLVGGIAGYIEGATTQPAEIRRSINTGSVNGGMVVGGLVGQNDGASIVDSYNTGAIYGSDHVGGLVGDNNSGSILTSFSTGSVSAEGLLGGLVALNAGTVTSSYWNTDTSGTVDSDGGTGLTSLQMANVANWSGFDFAGTWVFNGAAGQPASLRNVASVNTWTGLAGDSAWSSAGNWSLGHAPTSLEYVSIPDLANTAYVEYASGSAAVRRIVSGERFDMTGGGLAINGSADFNAGLNMANGTSLTVGSILSVVSPSAGITLNGAISAQSVKFTGDGSITQSAAGSIAAQMLEAAILGDLSLAGTNDVRRLAVSANSLLYNGLGTLNIVAGNLTGGIQTTGDATITVAGDLTVEQDIVTQGGNIRLESTGGSIAFTDAASQVMSSGTYDHFDAGSITMVAGGVIDAERVNLAANGFSGGEGDGFNGGHGGAISLTAGGSLFANNLYARGGDGSDASRYGSSNAAGHGGNGGAITLVSTAGSITARSLDASGGHGGRADFDGEMGSLLAGNGGSGGNVSITASAGGVTLDGIKSDGGLAGSGIYFDGDNYIGGRGGSGGNVSIVAHDAIQFLMGEGNGSGAISSLGQNGWVSAGHGGNVTVSTVDGDIDIPGGILVWGGTGLHGAYDDSYNPVVGGTGGNGGSVTLRITGATAARTLNVGAVDTSGGNGGDGLTHYWSDENGLHADYLTLGGDGGAAGAVTATLRTAGPFAAGGLIRIEGIQAHGGDAGGYGSGGGNGGAGGNVLLSVTDGNILIATNCDGCVYGDINASGGAGGSTGQGDGTGGNAGSITLEALDITASRSIFVGNLFADGGDGGSYTPSLAGSGGDIAFRFTGANTGVIVFDNGEGGGSIANASDTLLKSGQIRMVSEDGSLVLRGNQLEIVSGKQAFIGANADLNVESETINARHGGGVAFEATTGNIDFSFEGPVLVNTSRDYAYGIDSGAVSMTAGGNINAGNVTINTQGGQGNYFDPATTDGGHGGAVTLTADGSISVADISTGGGIGGMSSYGNPGRGGDGGAVTISAGSWVETGSLYSAGGGGATSGGNGGTITITAVGSVDAGAIDTRGGNGDSATWQANGGHGGNAGNATINSQGYISTGAITATGGTGGNAYFDDELYTVWAAGNGGRGGAVQLLSDAGAQGITTVTIDVSGGVGGNGAAIGYVGSGWVPGGNGGDAGSVLARSGAELSIGSINAIGGDASYGGTGGAGGAVTLVAATTVQVNGDILTHGGEGGYGYSYSFGESPLQTYAGGRGGDGGSVSVDAGGNLAIYGYIDTHGAGGAISGGNGGNVSLTTVDGNISTGEISTYGTAGHQATLDDSGLPLAGANGGDAGNVSLRITGATAARTISTGWIDTSGGDGGYGYWDSELGYLTAGGAGGAGGTVLVSIAAAGAGSEIRIAGIDAYGGSGGAGQSGGAGGNGGNVTLRIADGDILIGGGDANSPITSYGGDGGGGTSAASGGAGGNAGAILIESLGTTTQRTISVGNLYAAGGYGGGDGEGGVAAYGSGGNITLRFTGAGGGRIDAFGGDGTLFENPSDTLAKSGTIRLVSEGGNLYVSSDDLVFSTGKTAVVQAFNQLDIDVYSLATNYGGGLTLAATNGDLNFTGSDISTRPMIDGMDSGAITMTAGGNIIAGTTVLDTRGTSGDAWNARPNGGRGGDVTLTAGGDIAIGDILASGGAGSSEVWNPGRGGDAGNVSLTASGGSITTGSITARGGYGYVSGGLGGAVSLTASGHVSAGSIDVSGGDGTDAWFDGETDSAAGGNGGDAGIVSVIAGTAAYGGDVSLGDIAAVGGRGGSAYYHSAYGGVVTLAAGNGGAGGSVNVSNSGQARDIEIGTVNVSGGVGGSPFGGEGSGLPGGDGGNAGSVDISGGRNLLLSWVAADGGNASGGYYGQFGGRGGDGGSIYLQAAGDISVGYIESYGGQGSFGNQYDGGESPIYFTGGRGGNGGNIELYAGGSVNVAQSITSSGGDGNLFGGNGGSITVVATDGDIYVGDSIRAGGGYAYEAGRDEFGVPMPGGTGGNGGNVTLQVTSASAARTISVNYGIYTSGGDSGGGYYDGESYQTDGGLGGNGGHVLVDLAGTNTAGSRIYIGGVRAQGGYGGDGAIGGTGGNGGNVALRVDDGDIEIAVDGEGYALESIWTYGGMGGSSYQSAQAGGVGGDAGSVELEVRNNTVSRSISLYGVTASSEGGWNYTDSLQGSSGQGADVTIRFGGDGVLTFGYGYSNGATTPGKSGAFLAESQTGALTVNAYYPGNEIYLESQSTNVFRAATNLMLGQAYYAADAGGSVRLEATSGDLTLADGAVVTTYNGGNAGAIELVAGRDILAAGAGIAATGGTGWGDAHPDGYAGGTFTVTAGRHVSIGSIDVHGGEGQDDYNGLPGNGGVAGSVIVNLNGANAQLALGDVNTTGGLPGTGGVSAGANGNLTVTAAGNLTFTGSGLNMAAGDIVATAQGNLTLDAAINNGAGNVALSATGDFINNVGAGALSVDTGNGYRWLVYAADPATSSFNLLDSGNRAVWNKTYTSYAPGSVVESGNRYLFALAPSLTVVGNNLTKTYGDDLTAALPTAYTLTGSVLSGVTGAFLGDNVALLAPTLTSAGAAATAGVTGSPYVLTVDVSGLTASGYTISKTDGTITVTPRQLTMSLPGTISKEYNGSDAAALSAITLGNLANGDVLTLAATTSAYDTRHVGTGKTVSYAGLTLQGAAAVNYSLPATSLTSQNGAITARALSTWTGAAGDGKWSTPGNWEGGVIPEAANVLAAAIPAGAGTVNFDMSAPTTLRTLDTYRSISLGAGSSLTLGTSLADVSTVQPGATLSVLGGTHTLGGTLNAAGLVISGGSLQGTGSLNLTGTGTLATLSGGTLGVANTYLPAGASMDVTGPVALSGALHNDGTVNIGGSGVLNVQSGGVLDAAGGTWANAGTVNVAGDVNASTGTAFDFAGGAWNFNDGARFTGAGTFSTSGGATLTLVGTGAGTTVAADASLDLTALAFAGSGKLTNLGTIAGTGATLGGFLDNQGTANFNGGTLVGGMINTGTMNITGNLIVQGASATHAGGVINLGGGATLTKDTGTLFWSGGSFEGSGTLAYINGATFAFSGNGDRIINNPNLTFAFTNLSLPNGSLTLQSGGLTFNGTTTIPGSTSLNMSGGTIVNNGPLNISGNFGLFGGQLSGNGAINMTGGTIDMPATSSVDWQATGPMSNSGTLNLGGRTITNAISNTGTINSSGGLTFTQALNNQGTFVFTGGSTTFLGGYSQSSGTTTLNGGNVVGDVTLNGGSLGGSGTITGNLVNIGGNVAPGFSPGTLNIVGNMTLGAGSVTTLELGGTGAGQYDVINVTGLATLGGTLNINYWGGFSGTGNFPVMTWGTSSGSFATINYPVAGFTMSYGSGGMTLDLASLVSPLIGTPMVDLLANQATNQLITLFEITDAQNDMFAVFDEEKGIRLAGGQEAVQACR